MMDDTAKFKRQTDVIGIADISDMVNLVNLVTLDIGKSGY